jgi:peptidoglycan/xylan/chitin deacetylase (PgdA/CDA1 family)
MSPRYDQFPTAGGGLDIPRYLTSHQGVLVEDFESAAAWTGTLMTPTDDAAHKRSGAKGVKFTSDAGPVTAKMVKTTGISHQFAATDVIQLDIYSTQHWSSSWALYLSNAVNLSTTNFASPSFYIYQGFNRIRILASDMVSTSGGDWANLILGLQLRCNAINGETPVVTIDNLRRNPDSQPAVLLTFDGGYVEHHSLVLPYMESVGAHFTDYVIGELVGTAGYCSIAQLQEMDAAGDDVGNHTWDHAGLDLLGDRATVQAHIDPCTDLLVDNDMPRAAYDLAYPGGGWNNTVVFDGMSDAGMLSGRKNGGTNPIVLPGRLWYELESRPIVTASVLADQEALFDRAVAEQAVAAIFMHRVTTTPGGTEDVDFDAVFKPLIEYGLSLGLPFLTITELRRLDAGIVRVATP